MDSNLCKALLANDKTQLKKCIDPFLKTLDMKEKKAVSFEKIKNWLEEQDCVENVEMERGVLESQPPIKVFLIKINTETKLRSIGVQIESDKFQLENPKR